VIKLRESVELVIRCGSTRPTFAPDNSRASRKIAVFVMPGDAAKMAE